MKRFEFESNFERWKSFESVHESMKGNALREIDATRVLAESLLEHPGFTPDEKLCFLVLRESNTSIAEWDTLNEGLLDKLKNLGQKVADKGKEYYEKIKKTIGEEIKGIPDFFNALKDGVKRLVGYIKEFLSKIFKYIFGDTESFVKKTVGNTAEMEKAATEAAGKDESQLKEEAVGVRDIVTGVPKLFSPKSVGDSVQTALEKSDKEDVEKEDLKVTTNESTASAAILAVASAVRLHTREEICEGIEFLNEEEGHEQHGMKIPFVSTIAHFLEKFPPFSWLSKLASWIGKNANSALSGISKLMKEKGALAEATEFVILGTLVGLGIEMIIKNQAKHAIVHLIPGVGSVVVVLGTIATAIWYVHFISTLGEGAGLKEVSHEIETGAQKIASHE